jgi:restriction system protein
MAYGEMWEINLRHEGLNKSCYIKGSDKYVVEQKVIAQRRTWDAEESTIKLESILQHTLQVNDAIDWNSLLIKKEFSEQKPLKPNLLDIPLEPNKTDSKYQPEIYFSDKIFGLKKTKLEDASKQFLADHDEWQKKVSAINKENIDLEKQYIEKLKKWESLRNKHEQDKLERSKVVSDIKKQYYDKEPETIKDYCDLVLTNSKYPDFFPKER